MAKVRGIVAKVEGKNCILITPQGEFLKSRTGHPVRVGQEVEITQSIHPWYKLAVAVAAVFILSLVIPFYPLLTANAQPVASLSLDINPSLELGINKDGLVVDIRAFNQAGENLLRNTPVKQLEVYRAVQLLVEEAVREGFVNQEKGNVIVAAYTGAKYHFDEQKLKAAVKEKISGTNLSAEVLVVSTSMEIHQQARANQVSQGKYLMFVAAKANGKELSLDELKKNGINEALKSKEVKVEDLAPGLTRVGPADPGEDHQTPGKSFQKEDKDQTDKNKGKTGKNNGKTDKNNSREKQDKGKTDKSDEKFDKPEGRPDNQNGDKEESKINDDDD